MDNPIPTFVRYDSYRIYNKIVNVASTYIHLLKLYFGYGY